MGKDRVKVENAVYAYEAYKYYTCRNDTLHDRVTSLSLLSRDRARLTSGASKHAASSRGR